MKLAAVTTYYNPLGYKNPRRNYGMFLDRLQTQMPREDIYSVELSFNGQFELGDKNVFRLHGSSKNLMWQKERLVNHAVENLPSRYTHVAWLDCDLLFHDNSWVAEAKDRLKSSQAVQLFSDVEYTDASLMTDYSKVGFIRNWKSGFTLGPETVAPGGAWAIGREHFPIPDRHITGGGDCFFAFPAVDFTNNYLLEQMGGAWQSHYQKESSSIRSAIDSRVSHLQAPVTHLFHGTKENRRYGDRTRILREGQYDPLSDVVSRNGLLEWSTPKGLMHDRVAKYFGDRKEDGSSSEWIEKESRLSCYYMPLTGAGF